MRRAWCALTALVLALAAGCEDPAPGTAVSGERRDAPPGTAVFEWFEYTGNDAVFDLPLGESGYRNPVAAGFFPDPSITRRGGDYYMVHSSFAYAPGVPVLHSRNLVDWELIGHALTRPEQLTLEDQQVSRGIFAPTIRYHDGLFWLITTAIDTGGNFLVTAEDPTGPWSDPLWLPEIDGIDPDIFFDDDGRAYIAHNGPPEGAPLYDGHRAIWLWEFDRKERRVVASSGRVIVNGGVDLAAQPIWIEAPHLFKVDGRYYLLCAEGGTGYEHSEVVFRTDSLDEPFVPYAGNPILTQRDLDLDRERPVTTAGHADMVRTPEGDWWAVFLATRPYERWYYNTGRETFLLPVTWRDGWPFILEQGREIPYRAPRPRTGEATAAAEPLTGNFTWRDEFDTTQPSLHWNLLRGFDRSWLELRDGRLLMRPRTADMAALKQPAYLGRRQQHMRYRVTAALRMPADGGFSAGVVAFQNETHHYYLGLRRSDGAYEVFLEQANAGTPRAIRRADVDGAPGELLLLEISGNAGAIGFSWRRPGAEPQALAENLDGKLLSTEVAGGFVGTTLGPHARSEL